MKTRYVFFSLFVLVNSHSLFAQDNARLSITVTLAKEIIIVVQADCHQQYGLAYPITYQLDFPSGLTALKVLERHQTTEAWVQMPEKFSDDLFDAVEAVRFDYTIGRAYISAAFNGTSDSLFLQMEDSLGNPVTIAYQGISKYYDNRKAVVTISCDDWADQFAYTMSPLMNMFRSRGLYITAGIITAPEYISSPTWSALQQEVDSGYVEAASHSRTHSFTPYADPVGEVQGSALDIKQHLALPPLFSSNGNEYVYTWIAPYGDYDLTIDYLLGTSGYLAARLYSNLDTTSPRIYIYGDSTLTNWNAYSNHFDPFLPTVELGAPSWGGGDTSLTSLNGLFDAVLAKGDVYHVMWHPQVIITDTGKGYLVNHLNYISGRSNVWYVNLGHLYLYHLVQGANIGTIASVASNNGNGIPDSYELLQNYPNPFNPSTIISYQLPVNGTVTLKVYDVLGREVKTLVNERQNAGSHSATFNGSNLPSGVYLYRLQAGNFGKTKKLVILK
ncbi:MAG: T9SS type A sorting domain-containing protein [Candidatus Kryptoniota bacterium]